MFSGRVQGREYAFGVVELPDEWEFPRLSCHVQLVDPAKVFGRKHLIHCILLAERAFQEGTNLASSPELELLVRLAGTRQIKEAIRELEPAEKAVLLVFGGNARDCYEKALMELGAVETGEVKDRPGQEEAMEKAVLVSL